MTLHLPRETLDRGFGLPKPKPDHGWLIGWIVSCGTIGLAIALTQFLGG